MIKSVSYINYDKCTVFLEKHEANYLSEVLTNHIHKNSIKTKFIKKALYNLMENSDVRYFNLTHINEISKDLSARINEELGKNRHTLNTMPYQNLKKVLDNETFKSISFTTNTYTGEEELNIDGVVKTFKDKEEMNVFIRNLI